MFISFVLVTMLASRAFSFRKAAKFTSLRSSLLQVVTTSSSSSTPASKVKITQKGASEKLSKLRKYLQREGIDAFIVPTDDPHMSEYTASHYTRREYISGFTGSAGTAIITSDQACLFTDGRYWTQAAAELSSEWTLMKQGFEGVPTPTEFLSKTLQEGGKVGVDPYVHSSLVLGKLQGALKAEKDISIISVTENPLDSIWADEGGRESEPNGQVRIHPLDYAGKTVTEKLDEIRVDLKKNNAYAITSCSLDELCWLYNIRGSDVPCNPVTIAYGVVTTDSAHLFINDKKLNDIVRQHLKDSQVTVHPYTDILSFISKLNEKESMSEKVWMDPKSTNWALFNSISKEKRVEKESPLVGMKACKNAAEMKGMRACHIRDGAAESDFMSWLDETISHREVSEVEIDEVITNFRASYSPKGTDTEFIYPSFPTIAGSNSNGAIMHYRAVPETCKMVNKKSMLLIDSGGQYLDGTTDVTRTFHLGEPSKFQKEMFTRVLKGHINIDTRIFPIGTPGCLLDSYAREHLWSVGKDFVHGVGHGVGAGLNVHEGPCSISRLLNDHPLKPGMVLSNEPGYYEEGNFGIRIENLLEVVKRDDMGEFAGKPFLGFKRLTQIPIQKKMIDVSLLTDKEIQWINDYHCEVKGNIYPLLQNDRARTWVEEACKPISR